MANTSLIETAYAYISNQIRTGEFMPGTLLSENDLSDKLNMSRTPIRSAISRLEHEGLLVTLKNRGVLVKEISLKEVIDTMEVFYMIQLQCMDLLEKRVVEVDLKKLKAHLDRQLEAERENDYNRYLVSSMKFSECLLKAMNNGVVAQIVDAGIEKLMLYATINYKITPHEPHYSTNPLNLSVYEALVAEDYPRIREIANETYTYNRQRMVRVARL